MICMIQSDQHIPVRPNPEPPPKPGGAGQASAPGDVEDEVVDLDHVLPGQEEKHKTDSHEPAVLRSPKSMTAAEKAKHDVTHLPPHEGCAICRPTRSPNLWQTATNEALKTIPLLVGDDCFLKTYAEKYLAACLVLRVYPYKTFLGLHRS